MKLLKIVSILIFLSTTLIAKSPKLTIVLVIDQFSAQYLTKLKPFLSGGLKELSDHGVSYLNAFYDHSMPGTAPGHTLLSTGTYGSYHGIVNNSWFDHNGTRVQCDDDTAKEAAVFAPSGALYDFGKSARNIQVDTLSDQLILNSYPHARNSVWSLSLKSRAAISMAGRLGKAVWLDDKTGNFTSSKAYFKELPGWIQSFNKKSGISSIKEATWHPFFKCSSPAYNFDEIDNYAYASKKKGMVGKTFTIDKEKGFDDLFNKLPQANENLINFALECIDKNYSGKNNERFVLWLSLSSLDKVGHVYGPYSKEVIDMVYHMDNHIKKLMSSIYKKVDPQDVLFVFTADHGVQPIPEILQDKGLDLAKRYNYNTIVKELNEKILKKFGVKECILQFKEPQFYLNHKALASLKESDKKSIEKIIKDYMLALPGIRRAWTFDELRNATFESYDLDRYLQRQLFRNRSGDIIYSVNPYTTIDTHQTGTSHISAYAFDTTIPLIFYRPGILERKKIVTNVYIPQVSVTLATMLGVPRPSAAAANVLPGLKF